MGPENRNINEMRNAIFRIGFVMRLNRFFHHLDRISFFSINIWNFSYHSFFKEYARLFFFKVMVGYPLRTIRGLKKYRHFIKQKENLFFKYGQFLFITDEKAFLEKIKKQKIKPLVGLGFCLKPNNPENASFCPSGRANHDCLYLEKGQALQVCFYCSIYKISRKCLETGCDVYIMTSAKDIARDFLIPQVKDEKFPSAILLLCPYSIQAIIFPLLICGVDVFLMAYERGFCRDYREWRSADKGNKNEMTELSKESWKKIFDLLSESRDVNSQFQRFRREGNIFYPE